MDYSIMFFDECARCRQFDPDHEHKNCSFSVERIDNIAIQTFECTRCHFKWTKEIDHADSFDNRSTFRRKAG
jgi:hypothetical protein